MSELEDLARRLTAVEERLIMREAPPMDRLSGIDLAVMISGADGARRR